MEYLWPVSVIIIGYLLGSISTAVLVCRLMGLTDPRTEGSGNPGATNVMRIGGKRAAVLTLLGDVLKGVVAVSFAVLWVPGAAVYTLLAVFLGHLYPIFFQFKGGKGVATAIGGIVVWHWQVALLVILTWMLTFLCFRISSLAALSASLGLLAYLAVNPNWVLSWPLVVMVVLLWWRHRANLARLWSGAEK